MRDRNFNIYLLVRLLVLFAMLLWITAMSGAQNLNYVTSWVGNTFAGTPNMSHVQLNIDGLFVNPEGQCFTTSSWDEGGRTDSIYQNGKILTPPDFAGDLNSDQVVTDGTYIYYAGWDGVNRYTMSGTASGNFGSGIVNGLAIKGGKIYVSETSANLVQIFSTATESLLDSFPVASPTRIAVDNSGGIWVAHYLESGCRATGTVDCFNSSGTHLRSITLPNQGDAAALTIDNTGRLLVCDNGPDLNIKIYTNLTAASPTLSSHFGSQGGILAGPTPGQDGPTRFLAMTGVGVDGAGNIYVSQNGKGPGYLPYGPNGTGAVLEAFTPAGTRKWRLQGLEFVSLADVDPVSDTDVFDLGHSFSMNWNATIPGTEATYLGCTYNQFKYPEDNRYDPAANLSVVNSISCHRFQGHLFLYMSSQAGSFYEIYRLDPTTDGQVAIPCGGFSYGGGNGYLNVANSPPSGEWIWYDRNANGNPESTEFTQPSNATHIDGQWWFTDTNGDVWEARGEGPAIGHYAIQGLNGRGVPVYNWQHFTAENAPDGFTGIDKIVYLPSTDTMYLMGNSLSLLAAYPQWSKGNRVAAWSVTLPGGAQNAQPAGMAVEGDYVFVDFYVPHQILAYSVADGSLVNTIVPGPEVGGPGAVGNVDQPMCINVHQRANGEYIIFGEEDFQAKVLMYRWNPMAPTVIATPGNEQVQLSWTPSQALKATTFTAA